MTSNAHSRTAPRRVQGLLALVLVLAHGIAPSLHARQSPSEARASAETSWAAHLAHDAGACSICHELARSAGMQPRPVAQTYATPCLSLLLAAPPVREASPLALLASASPRAPPAARASLPV